MRAVGKTRSVRNVVKMSAQYQSWHDAELSMEKIQERDLSPNNLDTDKKDIVLFFVDDHHHTAYISLSESRPRSL